jgi:hypothetical protein
MMITMPVEMSDTMLASLPAELVLEEWKRVGEPTEGCAMEYAPANTLINIGVRSV